MVVIDFSYNEINGLLFKFFVELLNLFVLLLEYNKFIGMILKEYVIRVVMVLF